MALFYCNNKSDCSLIAIAASIIIGIIAATLRFIAVITVTPAFLWVLFGIAVLFLAITPIISTVIRNSGIRGCVSSVLPTLLSGILGTILTSLVLLAIPFAATSAIGAIITGALLTFFSLIVISFACLAICTVTRQNNSGV